MLEVNGVIYEYDDVVNADSLVTLGTPFVQTGLPTGIHFTPRNFRVESRDGGGFDSVSETFIFSSIRSVSGDPFQSVIAAAEGFYLTTSGVQLTADVVGTATNNDNLSEMATLNGSAFATGANHWVSDPISISPLFGMTANDVAWRIDITLTADTDAIGEIAIIEADRIIVSASTVPVPAAVWLFGSALGLLGWIRRKATLLNT